MLKKATSDVLGVAGRPFSASCCFQYDSLQAKIRNGTVPKIAFP